MKSVIKFVSGAAAVLVATVGTASANGALNLVPEPGSLALVGLAVGALVLVARRKK